MQVSSPLLGVRRNTHQVVKTESLNPSLQNEREVAGVEGDSSGDETFSLGTSRRGKMPGTKQDDAASVSHSALSQSSAEPQRDVAWSTTSGPSSAAAQSSSPAPRDISPQSSAVEVQQQKRQTSDFMRYPNLQDLKAEERGLYLIQLLLACATAVASGNMEDTNVCLEHLSHLASLTGDSMQRVASYFMEGLAARSTRFCTRSWPGMFRALRSTQYPSSVEIVSARKVFFNVCPYLKFAFLTVNQAIMDSMEGEKVVHVIDLQATDAVQWLALLQALRTRPGGPPLLKLTGISEKQNVLEEMGQRLAEEAENLGVSFQFVPVISKLVDVEAETLNVKSGEAVAVSSVMRFHSLLNQDDLICSSPSRGNGEVERAIPRGQVVNGTVDGTKERYVFRSLGGGTFKLVGSEERNHDALPALADEERSTKRKREPIEDNIPQSKSLLISDHVVGTLGPPGTADANQRHCRRSETYGQERTSCSGEGGCFETSQSHNDSSMAAMEKVLRMIKRLGPKVMVVVEQESNHNSSVLEERFVEALHYYCALFDSLDSTLPQQCLERVTLEKYLFGLEIKNIVACEGLERIERHEKLDKWKTRLRKVGFNSLPLSYSTVMQANRLLNSYQCEGYRLNEASGCLTLAWQGTPLYSASAWHS